MNRRRVRRGEFFIVSAALAFALFGTWYRAFISQDGILAQGGVMGLIVYLIGQLLLNAEYEIAYETINHRVDRVEECLVRNGISVPPDDDA